MSAKSSVKHAQEARSKRHKLKYNFIVGGLLLLAILIIWPYVSEFLEENDVKDLPKITVESVDLDKKTVTNPKIIGSDSENQPYTVTAASAEQGKDDLVTLDQVRGELKLKDGKSVNARARKGKTHTNKSDEVYLYDTVHITYDNNNKAKTKDAHLDFKKGIIYGENPIEGEGPDGVTSAKGFSFDYKKKILTLKGDAKLVIFNEA